MLDCFAEGMSDDLILVVKAQQRSLLESNKSLGFRHYGVRVETLEFSWCQYVLAFGGGIGICLVGVQQPRKLEIPVGYC